LGFGERSKLKVARVGSKLDRPSDHATAEKRNRREVAMLTHGNINRPKEANPQASALKVTFLYFMT
jgi:hypothetical protein